MIILVDMNRVHKMNSENRILMNIYFLFLDYI